jgi:hypothetical protein
MQLERDHKILWWTALSAVQVVANGMSLYLRNKHPKDITAYCSSQHHIILDFISGMSLLLALIVRAQSFHLTLMQFSRCSG